MFVNTARFGVARAIHSSDWLRCECEGCGARRSAAGGWVHASVLKLMVPKDVGAWRQGRIWR